MRIKVCLNNIKKSIKNKKNIKYNQKKTLQDILDRIDRDTQEKHTETDTKLLQYDREWLYNEVMVLRGELDMSLRIIDWVSDELKYSKDIVSGCPCLHTKPCHPECACIDHFSSRGCERCSIHGSTEQKKKRAEHLADIIDRANKKRIIPKNFGYNNLEND